MKPLVSILIPAYNAEEWIAYTLQSAVAQTWPRKEIIVVDDGSTDRTAEVARRFASKGVTVRLHGEPGSLRRARTMPSSLAKGTTSSIWTRMIFWHRTRSSGSLRRCGKLTAGEYFFPRRGPPSTIGPATRASFATPCGKTFLPSSGS